MSKYKINKISEIEINQLSDFYKKIYHKRYKSLTSNCRWWYRVGYNDFEPLILSIGDRIIGQAGLLPTDLNILGNKVQAIWFTDFAILPEFQGKGFGKILTKEWMKICPNQITFCNNLSLKIFKKFGWKNNLSVKRQVKLFNALKLFPIVKKFELNFINSAIRHFIKKKYSQNFSINPYQIDSNFKIINDTFKVKKIIKNDEFAEIVRDEKWLQWRLLECPYKKDLYFFEHKNNFAIVHIFVTGNIKRLNILYIYFTDNPQVNELIMSITNWSINNNIDLLWMVNRDRDKDIEKIFPRFLNKSINFASWSSDNKISKILQNGLFDPQGIDSDVDSNLYIE